MTTTQQYNREALLKARLHLLKIDLEHLENSPFREDTVNYLRNQIHKVEAQLQEIQQAK